MLTDSDLELRVLGRLAVVRGGSELALRGRRQRLVLARLICDAGNVIPAERLVDEIWGENRPGTGTGPLRTYIWELRRLLEPGDPLGNDRRTTTPGILASRDGGYVLDIERDRLDSVRFEGLLTHAWANVESGRPERALARLDDALGLWRGPVFADLAGEAAVQAEVARLDQALLEARELHAELLLVTGQEGRAAVELDALTRAHPTHERLWAMFMVSLYRSGRQADALRCFQDARATLVEQLGIEPGAELHALELAVLHQDPALHTRHWPRRSTGDGRTVDIPISGAGNGNGSGDSPAAPEPGGHNLPRPLTSLVGRSTERSTVARLLDRSRLVTLSGSGGCGKTRLALTVAEDVIPRFPGGVWFVDLSAVSDPKLVSHVLAELLGEEIGRVDRLDHVCRRIADTEALLVLDNCEHLVEAVAEVTEQLLTGCKALRILATSREELSVGLEVVWRVPGLGLPPPDSHNGEEDSLLKSEAVQLFVERGRSALPEFAPSGAALGAVAQVCRRLDGIPLAIELAAALVGSMPVTNIAHRLDDRLRLLTPGRRSGLPRHRTLRAAFDWSFDLLDEPAQRLFAQLGVFVGSFSLSAAEAIAGTDTDPLAVTRGVAHLVRTSMVDSVSGNGGVQRYRMQETIRQYACQRLEHLDQLDQVRRRHACYFADFAAEAERHVHGPTASAWLERMFLELPNLRAAAAWAFSHDDLETATRLAGSLPWFFARMGLLDEAAHSLDTGLVRRDKLPADVHLKALTAASNVAFTRGELSRAERLGEASIALARQLDDVHELAVALMSRGATAVWAGDVTRADACFTEADLLTARLHDRWGRAWMLTCWSAATHYAGDTARSRHQVHEALDLFRDLHDLHGQVLPLVHLALFVLEEGRIDEARDLARNAVRSAVQSDGRDMQHVSLCMLGVVELVAGRLPQARQLLVRSVRDFPGSYNWLILTRALESLAWLSSTAGNASDGAALLGFAQHARERWHIPASAAWTALVRKWRAELEATLGSAVAAQTISRGRDLQLDDAVELAETATVRLATSLVI